MSLQAKYLYNFYFLTKGVYLDHSFKKVLNSVNDILYFLIYSLSSKIKYRSHCVSRNNNCPNLTIKVGFCFPLYREIIAKN